MKLVVYSERWGHTDTYNIRKTKMGWYVEFAAIKGECDRSGYPFLFKNLDQDFIRYPSDLGYKFEDLWMRAESQNLSEEEMQIELSNIAEEIQRMNKG